MSRNKGRKKQDAAAKPAPAPEQETEPDRKSKPRQLLLWAAGIATALVTALVVGLGTNLAQDLTTSIRGWFGSPTPRLTLGSLSVTEKNGSYDFEVPVSNLQSTDQPVQRISIYVGWEIPAANHCTGIGHATGPTYRYSVSHSLTLQGGGSVSGEVDDGGGFIARATGSLKTVCGTNELGLSFTPQGLVLTGKTTPVISITMPTNMMATPANKLADVAGAVTIPNFHTQASLWVNALVEVKFDSHVQTAECEITDSSTTSSC